MDITVLFDLTKRKKWEELEEAWLKFAENPSQDPSFYEKFIKGMVKRSEEERCDQMLGLLVQSLTEQKKSAEGLKIARICLPHLEAANQLREALITALTEHYGKRRNFDVFMKASQLRESPQVGKAFRAFLTYANFDVGEAYLHKSWGVGTILSIDVAEKKITIRFPERPAAEFTITGAREYLRRLPRAHFLSRMSREPEKMQQLAVNDPTAMTKMAIKSLGCPLKVGELKSEMVRYMMDDGAWKSWWSKSRDTIRVDPYIEFRGAGLNASIALRDKPVSIYDQALEQIMSASTPRKRLEAVRSCGRSSQKIPPTTDEITRIELWLLDQYAKTQWDAVKIEMLFLMEHLQKIPGDHQVLPVQRQSEIVAQSQNLLETIQELTIFDYQAPVLDLIQATRDDWNEQYEEILPELPARLALRGIQALQKAGMLESLRAVAEALLTDPTRGHISSYLWALEEYIHGRWEAFAPTLSMDMTMERLLEHLSDLVAAYIPSAEDGPEARADINAVRDFFEKHQHRNIRKAISQMTEHGARRLYERVQTHPGFDSSERAHIASALRAERPELEEKQEENLLSSIYHYVSKKSRDRQAEVLQRIRSVDIPANSKRIGAAAALGDLSENSEYDSAKEEQGRLMSRASELEDLLKYARILDPSQVKENTVAPGCRLTIESENGLEETYTLLGIWDADPENNVLSYRSPLGAQFLGKSVNDVITVDLPSGTSQRCTIKRIENALL